MGLTMNEIYKKWVPSDRVDRELFVDAVHDDLEGMRIILSGKSPKSGVFCITFNHYYLYRNVNESNRIKLWTEGNFENKNWSLFRVENSNLIDWIAEETGEFFDKKKAQHYFIKTEMDIIDIVTHHSLPEFKWLSDPVDDVSENATVKHGKRSIHKFL